MFIKSQISECSWPAVPNNAGSQALALQYQLDRTQWLAPGELARAQLRQLQSLIEAACRYIPHWRTVFAKSGLRPGVRVDAALFAQLPILTRLDVQQSPSDMFNCELRSAHGTVVEGYTSGSTGTPVRFYRTDVTDHFWRALALREHLWQRRDFAGKLAAIRSNVEDNSASNWGPATAHVVETGPACSLNIRTDIDKQLDWLAEENPDYVLTHPSNLGELARRALERGLALPRLRQLRTFGEVLGNDTIAVCRRAWNVGIADIYSSEEAGYIASQCERGTYHVQAENLIVEILDDAGNACAPGQCGRVVITTLHNFVMPLIRYDIGDYAEVGTPCACGRGLPVLRRIVGRRRNMLRLPDGTQHWPSFPEERWVGIAPIEQLQVVQTALDEIVLRVAAKRALTAEENARLIAAFKDTLRFPHGIAIEQVASIPRKPNAKFEDFVSEIEQAL